MAWLLQALVVLEPECSIFHGQSEWTTVKTLFQGRTGGGPGALWRCFSMKGDAPNPVVTTTPSLKLHRAERLALDPARSFDDRPSRALVSLPPPGNVSLPRFSQVATACRRVFLTDSARVQAQPMPPWRQRGTPG